MLQRIKVYTSTDYIDILKSLLVDWEIDKIGGLTDGAEKARDFLMALPNRLTRITERIKIPQKQYEFKWIGVRT